MLNEAAKHLREGILLGRTDIIKKLLEEVRQTIKNEKEGKDKILEMHMTTGYQVIIRVG